MLVRSAPKSIASQILGGGLNTSSSESKDSSFSVMVIGSANVI